MIRIIRRGKVKMEKDPGHDANIRDELMQITEELNRIKPSFSDPTHAKHGNEVRG